MPERVGIHATELDSLPELREQDFFQSSATSSQNHQSEIVHMQKNHFELSIDCDSEQEAKCIASSMQLELNQPFEKRSKTKIQSKKNALMVFIRSEDSKSLRASIQSHAKLAIMLSSIPGGN